MKTSRRSLFTVAGIIAVLAGVAFANLTTEAGAQIVPEFCYQERCNAGGDHCHQTWLLRNCELDKACFEIHEGIWVCFSMCRTYDCVLF